MIEVNEMACPKNHACPAVKRCPEEAIIQDDMHSAPRIDHERCTECGACASACPVFSLAPETTGVL
jgi:Fe-S-cluster-containing hydrogenase component 2